MNEILSINNLTKTFSSQSGQDEVLRDLSLSVKEREFVCILGPSGCGKSTLLRCIACFEQFQGSIVCNGKTVNNPGTDRIMVFQDYNQLFPWKTVEGNIQYPLKLQGIRDKKKLGEISDLYLKKVGLDGYQKYYPHELSGGMKQRVAIAKALALKPELILMDEPFAALDAITRNSLQAELHTIAEQEGITVLFVTHNIQEAITLGTRIILMGKNGKIAIDDINPLPKPVRPSTPGYGKLWDRYSQALQAESASMKK